MKLSLLLINCVLHSEFHTSAVIDSGNYRAAADCYRPNHHIPPNNGDAVVVCLLCQLLPGGQIDIIQGCGGEVDV